MTTLTVVSIRDRAANAFGRPAFVPSNGIAIRSFTDEVNRRADDNQMFHHPEDFDLYLLGTFDDDNARFETLDQPRVLTRASDVKSAT